MAPRESLPDCWTTKIQGADIDHGSMRVRPSRLVSVSSMLGSGLAGSSRSSSRWKQEAHDLFGLKRLARAYFRSDEHYTKEEAPDYSVLRLHPKGTKLNKNQTSSATLIQSNHRAPQSTDGAAKPLLPQKRHCYSVSMGSLIEGRDVNVKILKTPVVVESGENVSNFGEIKGVKRSSLKSSSLLNKQHVNAAFLQNSQHDPETGEERVVQILELPQGVGIQSLLSQVYGGPLEKVHVSKDSRDTLTKGVQLHFLFNEDAKSFISYGLSNNFRINGFIVKPQWAPKSTCSLSNMNFGEVKDMVTTNASTGRQEGTRTRRCIVVKKTGCTKSPRSRQLHSNRQSLCSFDFKDLRKDFEQFGEIAEISPMISRKLCVSVSFYDIRSAINALESFEKPDSFMHKKYNQDWTMAYGRDTTDRACYHMF
ncbi:LAQU0S01e05886g1_1 [Lachancea quebecensis]|uniref:LAQU0S01e05886g1_1 n=1 Tax=Lachancea quebecensis TaxID=1654605 RepID=A0A0N7MKT9_9SACH|nr:LAQU0S01e05886g1_1 [Lachancea quebecensis]